MVEAPHGGGDLVTHELHGSLGNGDVDRIRATRRGDRGFRERAQRSRVADPVHQSWNNVLRDVLLEPMRDALAGHGAGVDRHETGIELLRQRRRRRQQNRVAARAKAPVRGEPIDPPQLTSRAGSNGAGQRARGQRLAPRIGAAPDRERALVVPDLHLDVVVGGSGDPEPQRSWGRTPLLPDPVTVGHSVRRAGDHAEVQLGVLVPGAHPHDVHPVGRSLQFQVREDARRQVVGG
jgi:hypothetical protein